MSIGTPGCHACRLPTDRLDALEKALVEGRPYRAVADEFGLTQFAVMRHGKKCLPPALAETISAQRLVSREGTVDELVSHVLDGYAMLARMRDGGKGLAEVAAYNAVTKALALKARVAGEMPTSVSVSVTNIAAVERIVGVILPLLGEHPEYRERITHAVLALDDGEVSPAAVRDRLVVSSP